MKSTEIWKRIEIVGDIAIIGIPFGKSPEDLREYAEEIMREHKYVKSVWGRYRNTRGEYRLTDYYHIAGEKRSATIYKEHGCLYYLDFTRVFFSQTLSYEHLRVAKQVKKGEKVINLFAGFGPFSILSAKLGDPEVVYSIDLNPYAYYFMLVNVNLNRTYNVIPMYGDAFKRVYDVEEVDRVISPLPEKHREAYEVARQKVKKGGVIHLFVEVEVKKGQDPVKEAMKEYPKAFFGRVVRSVSPSRYHIVLDIRE
ncbi:MAG: hypothetical protein ASUL_06894 [Candidatus Aramenus sulfurataquae]|jgi:tRNA (guanine37-N1)-methyltransferase|uniref:Methyltransferase n=2 Tax=Candidatus Aramenus sulfurataquae TaxID=1326980 RepID=W7KHY3_9CREN|nr:MAG: hypothetical protein ASUL_06894 [Candidatus Aramenus sulfurataquae]MCL7343628.1 class I SAM-dependent methyltransferase family protein [Candidatus Aramenus sulfurataquae]